MLLQELTIAISLTAGAVVAGALPAAAQGDYYTDRRTGCRVWLPGTYEAGTAFQWAGACKNGLAEGRGFVVVTPPPGSAGQEVRNEGEWRDGKQFGRGLMTSRDGMRLESTWRDGLLNGRGFIVLRDGTRLDGTLVNDSWTGPATFTQPDGTRYVGDLVNMKKHGKGSLTTARGDRYEGEWEHDDPNGRAP